MDDQQQRELAQGLQCRDPEAWRALYEAHAARVWRHAARMLGNRPEDVADVVQEVFIAAARSAAGYDPARGTIWQWLSGVTRRQLAQHYRRRRRDDQLQAGDGHVLARDGRIVRWLDSGQVQPDADIETAELAAAVRAALVDLQEDYADMLLAKYVDGESTEQIAAEYGLTISATSSRLARARRAFRDIFAAQETGGAERET